MILPFSSACSLGALTAWCTCMTSCRAVGWTEAWILDHVVFREQHWNNSNSIFPARASVFIFILEEEASVMSLKAFKPWTNKLRWELIIRSQWEQRFVVLARTCMAQCSQGKMEQCCREGRCYCAVSVNHSPSAAVPSLIPPGLRTWNRC